MINSKIRFGILYIKEDYDKVLDFNFFQSIGCTFKYFSEDDINQIVQSVRRSEIDILLLTRYNHLEPDWVSQLNDIIRLVEQRIPILILDLWYPNVTLKDEYVGNTFILKDSSMGGVSPNIIEVPLLGVVNFDMLHLQRYNGNPHFKQFIIKQYDEFYNRTYDIMCKLGKPKPVKLLITLLAIKNNFHNPYINLSFSKENNIKSLDDINFGKMDTHIFSLGLENEFKSLLIGSYIGSLYTKNKIIDNDINDYNVDFNSYSEIYTETLSCELNNIQLRSELIAFTEKSFNNFFDYKIPLPIDSLSQINYLKKIGFEFPVEPCYLEKDDTIQTLYYKINNWMMGLKNYDFKKMWNNMIYSKHGNSALHKNNKLIFELMSNDFVKDGVKYWYSKPMFNATYKFIEKFFPNILESYRNWDYQTFLWLKNKNILN